MYVSAFRFFFHFRKSFYRRDLKRAVAIKIKYTGYSFITSQMLLYPVYIFLNGTAPNSYNAVFLSALRLMAIGITGMKEKRCFRPGSSLRKKRSFFFHSRVFSFKGKRRGRYLSFLLINGVRRHDTGSSKRCLKPHIILKGDHMRHFCRNQAV